MAGSVNKCILVGNLGKDPEVRRKQDGGMIVNLSVATSESWRDKQSGERKEKTEWHRVVCFNERASKFAEQYLKKGHKVYVEGQIQTRKWTDQSGVEKYSTEVVIQAFNGVLQSLHPVERSEGQSVEQTNTNSYADAHGRSQPQQRQQYSRANDDMDGDSIPF